MAESGWTENSATKSWGNSSQPLRRNGQAILRCREQSMPSNVFVPPAASVSDSEARAQFDRYRQRLIGLARIHLGGRLKSRVDPEDVVQSAYKSLLIRYGNAAISREGWEGLWGLLTRITIRKCADRAHYHQAECRNLHREADRASLWREIAGREPTPDEAVALAETLENLLLGLSGIERTIIELSLQGYSTREISEQIGRAERTVRRLREHARKQLEKQ